MADYLARKTAEEHFRLQAEIERRQQEAERQRERRSIVWFAAILNFIGAIGVAIGNRSFPDQLGNDMATFVLCLSPTLVCIAVVAIIKVTGSLGSSGRPDLLSSPDKSDTSSLPVQRTPGRSAGDQARTPNPPKSEREAKDRTLPPPR